MLSEMKCVRIEKGTPPVSEMEAKRILSEIPQWALSNTSISREFKFKDFKEAMQFVNKIAGLANAEDHHPDIFISYSRVKLECSTHKIGGLSINDFILAAKADLIQPE